MQKCKNGFNAIVYALFNSYLVCSSSSSSLPLLSFVSNFVNFTFSQSIFPIHCSKSFNFVMHLDLVRLYYDRGMGVFVHARACRAVRCAVHWKIECTDKMLANFIYPLPQTWHSHFSLVFVADDFLFLFRFRCVLLVKLQLQLQ